VAMLLARRFIIALELIVGVLALFGGIALVVEPSGGVLGFDTTMLHGIFQSFRWPGVALIGMGLLHFAAAWTELRGWLWDHVLSAAAGVALILWISVQVVIIGFHDWTQPVFFLLGNALLYMATEMWRLGEGPHLGLVDGFEHLDDTHRAGARSNDHRATPPDVAAEQRPPPRRAFARRA